MTGINPQNYPGANAVVVGNATAEPSIRNFENGGSQAELNIAVDTGYKNRESGEWVQTGTNFYRLVASPDWARENWPTIEKGDRVRIDDARLEARSFLKNDGEAGVELRLQFGTVTIVERKADRQAASGGGFSSEGSFAAQGTGDYSDNTPF